MGEVTISDQTEGSGSTSLTTTPHAAGGRRVLHENLPKSLEFQGEFEGVKPKETPQIERPVSHTAANPFITAY